MKQLMTPSMRKFLQFDESREEAIDQPLYHYTAYPQAGQAADLNFFGAVKATATNGAADTNVDIPNQLGSDKRMAIRAISVHFVPGVAPVQLDATQALKSAANDAKAVLEGLAYLTLTIGDKPYLIESPLAALPAGIGTAVAAGGVQETQGAAANGTMQASYGTNGVPVFSAIRPLLVPLALWKTSKFAASISFPGGAIAVSAAARVGVRLWGVQIRPRQ
jgi:hypothetical protein